MYNPDYLIKETHALKINWLRAQLSNLPRGTIVNRSGNAYVVVYENKNLGILKRFERSVQTEEGVKYKNMILKYNDYRKELKQLETLWKNIYRIPVPVINVCDEVVYERKNNELIKPQLILDENAFNKMKAQQNDYPKERWIEFNGINYRSIQERSIAELLTDLNWEFKYEVSFDSNGHVLSCDFAILVRELGVVKFLEFLGMMDSERYLLRVKKKMNEYSSLGLIEDKDIIYIFADEKNSINIRSVASKLNLMILNHI